MADFLKRKSQVSREALPLLEYLKQWDKDPALKANTAGRMMLGIGKGEVIDTSKDERLGRIFSQRTITTYPAFSGMLGVEDTIQTIVDFFRHAAEGLQQKNKILYLYGPPGSGKSKIIELLKRLFEKEYMFVLAVKDESAKGEKPSYILSPVFESPLGLFDLTTDGADLESEFKIPPSRLEAPMSQWAAGELDRFEGDRTKFFVVPVRPSMVTRTGIAQVVPGSMEHPDLGSLIGYAGTKSDFSDYLHVGGLNRTTQGLMEFFEMFKAHPDLFTPLLAAPQDRKYAAASGAGELPYEGITLAHSNEADWKRFRRENQDNKAFLDRIFAVPVPYCLRVTEVAQIYRTHLDGSGFKNVPIPDHTLELAAFIAVASRMNKDHVGRLQFYDGTILDEWGETVRSKMSADELRKGEKWREGMVGISERFMLTTLPQVARADPENRGLNPVMLLEELEKIFMREDVLTFCEERDKVDPEEATQVVDILNDEAHLACVGIVTNFVKKAYLGDFDVFLKAHFERYVMLAEAWQEGESFKDPEADSTADPLTRQEIEAKLRPFEVGATSPADFRFRVVKAALRHRSDPEKNRGKLEWDSLDPPDWKLLRDNILPEKVDILKVAKFGKRQDAKEQAKHDEFVDKLCTFGFTRRTAQLTVEFYDMYC